MSEIALERAEQIAESVVKWLSPYCHPGYIKVVGSIRRKKPLVKDIDLVLIPLDPWNLHAELAKLGPGKMSGSKIVRVMNGNVQIDVYFADASTWGTLLLIRTGSAQNNIRLATLAKKKVWQLKANGEGLLDETGVVIAQTEESIYQALEIPWQEPEERD